MQVLGQEQLILCRRPYHFLYGGNPVFQLIYPASPERCHPQSDGFLFYFSRGGSHQDEFADLIVQGHDLVQSDAATVSRIVANRASRPAIAFKGPQFFF